MEKLELVCFQIITKAGVAKSNYATALNLAKKADFEGAKKLIEEGQNEFLEAHKVHAELVQKEAAGEKVDVSLFLMHAEDQLMSTEIFKSMAIEMIELYKELRK